MYKVIKEKIKEKFMDIYFVIEALVMLILFSIIILLVNGIIFGEINHVYLLVYGLLAFLLLLKAFKKRKEGLVSILGNVFLAILYLAFGFSYYHMLK